MQAGRDYRKDHDVMLLGKSEISFPKYQVDRIWFFCACYVLILQSGTGFFFKTNLPMLSYM